MFNLIVDIDMSLFTNDVQLETATELQQVNLNLLNKTFI